MAIVFPMLATAPALSPRLAARNKRGARLLRGVSALQRGHFPISGRQFGQERSIIARFLRQTVEIPQRIAHDAFAHRGRSCQRNDRVVVIEHDGAGELAHLVETLLGFGSFRARDLRLFGCDCACQAATPRPTTSARRTSAAAATARRLRRTNFDVR